MSCPCAAHIQGRAVLQQADNMALDRCGVVRRRGGIGRDQDLMEHCCILVHTAQASAPTQLATVLAAWLHWYGCLDLQTAIQVRTMSLSS